MIKVSSVVKLNFPRIKQLTRAQVTALEQTAEELHMEVVQAQVVPRRDGTLQGEAFFIDTSESSQGKVTLVHNTPYARRLYFHPEYNFRTGPWEETIQNKDGSVSHLSHEGNPNAKGLWFEDWESGGKRQNFVPQAFAEFYRRLSGL